MEMAPKQDLSVQQQLDEMRVTLRRICAELDLVINGLQHLLQAQGLRERAASIGDQLDLMRAERAPVEADTEPPPADA